MSKGFFILIGCKALMKNIIPFVKDEDKFLFAAVFKHLIESGNNRIILTDSGVGIGVSQIVEKCAFDSGDILLIGLTVFLVDVVEYDVNDIVLIQMLTEPRVLRHLQMFKHFAAVRAFPEECRDCICHDGFTEAARTGNADISLRLSGYSRHAWNGIVLGFQYGNQVFDNLGLIHVIQQRRIFPE